MVSRKEGNAPVLVKLSSKAVDARSCTKYAGPLLEHSRQLYDSITELLKEANIIDDDDM